MNTSSSILVPFFASEAKTRMGINDWIVGLIYAIHPVFGLITSLTANKFMLKFGRKNLLVFGVFIGGSSICCLGLLRFLDQSQQILYIVLAFTFRMLQGGCRSLFGSASFAMVPIYWPDSVDKVIAALEAMTGLGQLVGPLLGGVLYEIGKQKSEVVGYTTPFIINGAMVLIALLPTIFKVSDDKSPIQQKQKVSLGKILKNPRIVSTFLVLLGTSLALTYLQPLYATYTNYIYACGTLFYIAPMPLVVYLTKKIERKIVLWIGLVLSALSPCITATDPIFGLPNEWYVCMIGLCLIGLSHAFCCLPFPTEAKNLIKDMYPNEHQQASDLASGLFFAGYALGNIVGPSLSGFLCSIFEEIDGTEVEKERNGFLQTSRIFGLLQLFIAIIYLFAGKVIGEFFGSKVLKEEKIAKQQKKIKKNSSKSKNRDRLLSNSQIDSIKSHESIRGN